MSLPFVRSNLSHPPDTGLRNPKHPIIGRSVPSVALDLPHEGVGQSKRFALRISIKLPLSLRGGA